MTRKKFAITFDYQLENSSVTLPLIAVVELYQVKPYYLVNGISVLNRPGGSVLPDMKIRRLEGKWVHRDSDKESTLSAIAGAAIDEYERKMRTTN
jgi:hypothetical protein